ncbi:MAG TPA: hypothetical protein VFD84_07325 [Candidatus Binatia bacterium]|nr:hypothetical protein [Candidatus Binatia bacterium]
MTGGPTLAAVVLAGAGGARLARTLASVAWADERAVLDPTGALAGAELPAGVARVGGAVPGDAIRAPWVLALAAGEVVSPALRDAIAAALAGPAAAYRVAREVAGFDTVLRTRGAPIRLAPRAGARLALDRGLELAIGPLAGPVRRLAEPLLVPVGPTVREAVAALVADGGALAAVLRAAAVRPTARRMLAGAAAAALRVLAARAQARVRWGRWTLAVLAGYRTLYAYGRLWELLDAEAAARE